MRHSRTAMAAATLTIAFIVPSGASAQINSFQIGDTVQLGARGRRSTSP
jgi:hypothetical protein